MKTLRNSSYELDTVLLEEMCKQLGIKHFIHAFSSNAFIFLGYITKHSQNLFRVVKISQILSYDILFLVHTKDVNSLFDNFDFVSVSTTGSMSTYIQMVLRAHSY